MIQDFLQRQLAFHILLPPIPPTYYLPLRSRIFGCKNDRVTSESLFEVTSQESSLCFVRSHVPRINGIDSHEELPRQPSVTTSMSTTCSMWNMPRGLVGCKVVDCDSRAVVLNLSFRAVDP